MVFVKSKRLNWRVFYVKLNPIWGQESGLYRIIAELVRYFSREFLICTMHAEVSTFISKQANNVVIDFFFFAFCFCCTFSNVMNTTIQIKIRLLTYCVNDTSFQKMNALLGMSS